MIALVNGVFALTTSDVYVFALKMVTLMMSKSSIITNPAKPDKNLSNLKQINLVKKQDNLLYKLLVLRSRVGKQIKFVLRF